MNKVSLIVLAVFLLQKTYAQDNPLNLPLTEDTKKSAIQKC